MPKRKLTQNQTRRIRSKQQASRERTIDFDESSLGPEQEGRVIAHYGGQVEVEGEGSESKPTSPIRCFIRANVSQLVTGDRVIWRLCIVAEQKDPTGNDDNEASEPKPQQGVVVALHPRSSLLSRPDSYGNLKPAAANVDQIIITIAPKPAYHTNLIDRYLVIAENNHIEPIILLNKTDLLSEAQGHDVESLQTLYRALGYQVLAISAKQSQGLESLVATLKDKTSIFVGQSGVGKSSTINQLIPDLDIQVGNLSEAKAKGRHTTTHSQLFHFPQGGECIDSPGIREFGLWHLDAEAVVKGFRELHQYHGLCKFRDCTHSTEPGCAIQRALAEGDISPERFESYERIIASLDEVDVKAKP